MSIDDIPTYEELLLDAELDGMDIEEEIGKNDKSKSFCKGATNFSYGGKNFVANTFKEFEFTVTKK